MAQSALRALTQQLMQGGPAPAGMASAQTAIQDAAQRPQQKPIGQQIADVLGGVALPLSAAPVLGDIVGLGADAAMYANYPEERTALNYGLSLAGVLPFVPSAAGIRTAGEAAEGALDMSQAARMQRAREQGFNTANRFYVGTQADFEAFDPNFVGKFSSADTAGNISLTPSPSIASRYAEAAGDPISQYIPKQGIDMNAWNAAKSNLAELGKNISALQSVNNFDMWSQEYRKVSDEIINARKKLSQMSNIVNSTKGANVIPVYVRGQIKQVDAYGKAHDPNWMIQQQNIARKEGFDGVQFMGLEDAPGFDPIHGIADTLKIFDPSNIRSVNAAFDPAKRGSANLSAGIMGTAVGLSALRQLMPQQEQE